MKRRDAFKGIIGVTTIGFAFVKGIDIFDKGNQTSFKDISEYTMLISELTDVIIPSTDTPGAKEANVHNYIIGYMENCANKKDYKNFINGLIDIENESLRRYSLSFKNCSIKEKNLLVSALDDSTRNQLVRKISAKIRGRSFFDLLKSLTIEGYCTSELGVTKFLKYQPIPGQYLAITNLKNNQKAWATK